MKILHINSYYSAGKFYKNLYDEQLKNNLDIQVYVPVHTSFSSRDFEFGKYTTISKNHNKFDRFIFHQKHQKIYREVKNRYNINEFSLIHAHSLFSNGFIAMGLKEEFGIPYIVAVRNTDINTFFKYMIPLRHLGVKILANANKVIFLSGPYKKHVLVKYIPYKLKNTIDNKSLVIPNGIDEFWFKNKGEPKHWPINNSVRLLQIGDIEKNKNITTTISAINLLINKGYRIELDVVGKIKNQQIFKKVRRLNNVNYLGFVAKEKLIDIYRNNDIFVLPSIHETFGLVYAEAMSQGLPVIYSKKQGFDGQFVEGTVGYAVDSLDYNDIAEKVIKILDDYETKSRNCLKLFHKFDWKTIACEYLSLYKKCCKN